MYAAQVESALAGLKGAYDSSMAGYDAALEMLPQRYQGYRNDAAAQMATPYAVGAQAQKERQERDSELGRAKAALKKAESELVAWTDLWKDDQVQQAAAAVTKDPFAVTEALKKVREMPLDKLECRQAEQDVRGALYAAIAQSEEFKNWNYQDYHNVWDDDYYEKNPYDKYGMNLDITTSEAMAKAGETPVATEEEEKLLDFLIFKSHTDPAWRDNEDLTPNQYFQWWSTAISDPRVGKRWAEEAKEEGLWGGAKMVLNHAARSSEDALAGLIGLERSQGANAYAEAEYRDKLDGLGRVVFDAANTIGDMAPSMAMGTAFGPQAGLATMAAGAGGRSVEQSLREGHGRLESYGYGALTAASEAMLGRLLGGINKVGGGSGVFSNLAGKSVENIQNGFLRFAAKVGLNSADEALEEYTQGVLDPVFRNIMLGENNEITLISEDAAYDAFMALITTPFLEGPGQAKVEINQARALSDWGRQIQEMGPEVADTVLRAGLDSDKSTDAYKLAAKLADRQARDKTISDKDLGRLYQTVLAEESEQKTASTGEAGLPRMTMADFTDTASPVWRNVAYEDKTTQQQITQATHKQMVSEGRVVAVPESTAQKVAPFYPDVRALPRAGKNSVLKEKTDALKRTLRQFLGGLRDTSFEFEVNGNILEAKLYGRGISEVMKKLTQDKASMLYHSGEIFKGAQYLYSTPDYDGDPNIYRWNYFYTPVQIGSETVGVRIAVRDLKQTAYGVPESQIYHWGIKQGTSVDGGGPEQGSLSSRVSLDVPKDSIPQTAQDVNLKGRSLGDRVADATKRTLEEMARTEKKARFLKESKPLRDRLAQVQAEGEAGLAQTRAQYEKAVADRESGMTQEQTTQLEDIDETSSQSTGQKPTKLSLPDISINRSLGAKAKNYEIIDKSTGVVYHFLEGTHLQNVEVFAGSGVRVPLRQEVAEGLAQVFGGSPGVWQHVKGIGELTLDGEESRPAEVHWFQAAGVDKVKFYVKRWLDE